MAEGRCGGCRPSPCPLEAKNIALGHQVSVLRRKHAGQVRLSRLDRFFLTWLTRLYPPVLDAIVVVRPERPFCAGTGTVSGPCGGGNRSIWVGARP